MSYTSGDMVRCLTIAAAHFRWLSEGVHVSDTYRQKLLEISHLAERHAEALSAMTTSNFAEVVAASGSMLDDLFARYEAVKKQQPTAWYANGAVTSNCENGTKAYATVDEFLDANRELLSDPFHEALTTGNGLEDLLVNLGIPEERRASLLARLLERSDDIAWCRSKVLEELPRKPSGQVDGKAKGGIANQSG